MKNKILDIFKNLDKITYKIMKKGLIFCFSLCIISLFLLLFYDFKLQSPLLYDIGLSLFKLSTIFGIEFVVCGIVTDSIKKQLI